MDWNVPVLPMIIFAVSLGLIYSVMTFTFTRLFRGREFLASSLASAIMFFTIFAGFRDNFQTETGFVILHGKVGHPVVSTIFRVNPDKVKKDKNYCQVYGDKLYSHHNVSVFTAAKKGDVLRRHHYTSSSNMFGKTLWQYCHEVYMPVKHVSFYPDMNYWPFRKDDIKPGDPDYDRVTKLTKSQR